MIGFNQKIKSTDNRNYLISSDLHFGHRKIMEFCKETRPWSSLEEMHESLIEHWNSKVSGDDVVFHLGDFSFFAKEKTQSIIDQLNGNVVWIAGNHCYKVFNQLGIKYHNYFEINFDGKKICMSHYPIAAWHQQGRGSLHAHGHCMDYETQVLTEDGFKYRWELKNSDKIATMNLTTSKTEYQEIKNFIDFKYTGEMYTLNNRNVNMRVTDNHTIIYSKYYDSGECNNYKKSFAKDFFNRFNTPDLIPCASNNINKDYDISDLMLRLYVNIVTDGSIENLNLVRFHLRKQRKISNICNILDNLSITYSINLQKSGTTKINFKLPSDLNGYTIKPLDGFVKKLSKRQIDILVKEYSITDGNISSKNGVQISTAKLCEAELLQSVLVTSGYRCNMTTRSGGKYVGYVLSVNSRTSSCTSKTTERSIEKVKDEPVWCLVVDNGTLVTRRKGKVHITGNCHGSYEGQGKCHDVGWDANGKILTLQEFVGIADSKEVYCPDHHKII